MSGSLCALGHVSQQLARAVSLKTAQTCSTGVLILAAEESELILGIGFCKQLKDPAKSWPNYVITANCLPFATGESTHFHLIADLGQINVSELLALCPLSANLTTETVTTATAITKNELKWLNAIPKLFLRAIKLTQANEPSFLCYQHQCLSS